MQDKFARISEVLLRSPRKFVTLCLQSLGIKIPSTHTIIRWNLTLYPYKIQVVQLLTTVYKQRRREFCRDVLQFVQHYPANVDCLMMKHISISMDFWTKKQEVLAVWKNSQSRGDVTPSCKVSRVVCSQYERAYWTDLCEGHQNTPAAPAETAKWGHFCHSGKRARGHNISINILYGHIERIMSWMFCQ